jgi:hypothetical protein
MAHVWGVSGMDYIFNSGGKTNVITSLHWRCTKSEAGKKSFTYGQQTLDPPGDTFVEYSDVTESQAIQWLQTKLGSSQVSAIETEIDVKFAEQNTPSKSTGTPW